LGKFCALQKKAKRKTVLSMVHGTLFPSLLRLAIHKSFNHILTQIPVKIMI
jgi:hypothetical protein